MKMLLCPLFLAVCAFACASVFAGQRDVSAKSGDYEARMTKAGLSVSYKGKIISLGSYFTLWTPEYEQAYLSYAQALAVSQPVLSEDGQTLTLKADGTNGSIMYVVTLSENGVRVALRIKVTEGIIKGPSEYAPFQLPPGIVKAGSVEVANAAGIIVDSKPIPSIPSRGGFTSSGDRLTIKTPEKNIVISTTTPYGISAFDWRVERYGSKQGVWAFTSLPITTEQESVFVVEFKVDPPDVPQFVGTVCLESGVALTAVATLPKPAAREKLAADELVSYLEQISGKRLKRIEIEDGKIPAGVIVVGTLARRAGIVSQAKLDAVGFDGYVVRVANGKIGICGERDLGAVYGVYALLKHLGVKFYAPGCEIVPEVQELVIPDCELTVKPFYEFRNLAGNLKLGNTPENDMGNPREIGEKGSLVHSAAYLLPFDEYSPDHPEYFALQKDGERLHHKPNETRFDVHLCLSNPDVRRISAERMLELIEKQKDRTVFGVSQGDGFAWCECEECKALDAVPGVEMTDRLLDYVNYVARAVAEKYPDKRILTLAYTNATSPPPQKVMPEPNVMVQFCPYPNRVACQSHDLTCEKNKQGFEDLKGWIAKCPDNMYIFDYPRGYKIWYEPFGSFYAMKRKMDFYAANGIKGIYYCGMPTNFHDLFVFVQSYLLWEPETNIEPLIDEFMSAYYRAAAPHVREYFDFLHSEIDRRNIHQMCEGANPGVVTPEFSRKALDIFAKAEAAVADDPTSLYRVRAEKFCVLFADLNEHNLVNGKIADNEDAFARRLADLAEIGRAMKIRSLIREEERNVSAWLWRTAHLKPDSEPWYADPLTDRLISNPEKTLKDEPWRYSQRSIPGGVEVLIDSFLGGRGPERYAYQCEPRRAVWIYAQNSRTPEMWSKFFLEKAPGGAARLILEAQDCDKPGEVRIEITINGKTIFSGANNFKKSGWFRVEFPIPAGILKQGENEIRFSSLEPVGKRDSKWFMLSECKIMFK